MRDHWLESCRYPKVACQVRTGARHDTPLRVGSLAISIPFVPVALLSRAKRKENEDRYWQ
jgi:hypothetical protein